MQTQEMQAVANEITSKYGVPSYEVSMTSQRPISPAESTTMGSTFYRQHMIWINPNQPVECYIEVLMHELAHAVAYALEGVTGHNRVWRKWARRLGSHPRAKASVASRIAATSKAASKATRK